MTSEKAVCFSDQSTARETGHTNMILKCAVSVVRCSPLSLTEDEILVDPVDTRCGRCPTKVTVNAERLPARSCRQPVAFSSYSVFFSFSIVVFSEISDTLVLFRIVYCSCFFSSFVRKYLPQTNTGHRRTVRRSVGDRKATALQAACQIRCRVSSEHLAWETRLCVAGHFCLGGNRHGKHHAYSAYRGRSGTIHPR